MHTLENKTAVVFENMAGCTKYFTALSSNPGWRIPDPRGSCRIPDPRQDCRSLPSQSAQPEPGRHWAVVPTMRRWRWRRRWRMTRRLRRMWRRQGPTGWGGKAAHCWCQSDLPPLRSAFVSARQTSLWKCKLSYTLIMIRFFLYICNFFYLSNLLLLYFCISVCLPGTPLWTGSKWPGSVRQGGKVVDVGDVLQWEKGDVLQWATTWGIVKLEEMKSSSMYAPGSWQGHLAAVEDPGIAGLVGSWE